MRSVGIWQTLNRSVYSVHFFAWPQRFVYCFHEKCWKSAHVYAIFLQELCTKRYYLHLPLQWDSPFLLDLNLFFMRTQENGLALKWQEMTYWEASQMDFIDFKKPQEMPWRPLKIHDFNAAKNLYFFLSYFYIFVFLVEVFSYYCCSVAGRKRLQEGAKLARQRVLKERINSA